MPMNYFLHLFDGMSDGYVKLLLQITVGYQQCTIGQRLLGLKYPEVKNNLRLHYIFSILFPYLHHRIGQYLLKKNIAVSLVMLCRTSTSRRTKGPATRGYSY